MKVINDTFEFLFQITGVDFDLMEKGRKCPNKANQRPKMLGHSFRWEFIDLFGIRWWVVGNYAHRWTHFQNKSKCKLKRPINQLKNKGRYSQMKVARNNVYFYEILREIKSAHTIVDGAFCLPWWMTLYIFITNILS